MPSRSTEPIGQTAEREGGVVHQDERPDRWWPPSPSGPRRVRRSAGSVELACRKPVSGQSFLSDEVVQRLRTLAREGARGRSPRTERLLRRGVRLQTFVLCAVLGAAALLASLVVYFVFRGTAAHRELARAAWCQSAACDLLARSVLSQLNRNVDPCHDIQAHVCSRLKWDSDLTTDTDTDMMRQWYRRGAIFLETKATPEAAFSLYRACMNPDKNDVAHLAAFMRERGLLWPEYGSSGRHALYVVLDLLINWGVPFWFEMSLRRLPNESRYSLYINYVNTMDTWQRRKQVSADAGFLKSYASDLYSVFGASEAARSRIPTLLRQEAVMHDVIVSPEVRGQARGAGLSVMAVPLSLVSLFTPHISAEVWLSYLNEHLSPHRVQADDKVLMDDVGLARCMSALFGNFSNDDLLYTLGWWFAQKYTVVASMDGGLASYGSATVAQTNRPIDCYAVTESRFRRQLFYERAQASLGSAELNRAAELLANIRNTTIAMIRLLPWLDEEARNEAAHIVRATEFEPWTSEFGINTAGWPPLPPTSRKRNGEDRAIPQEPARLFTTAPGKTHLPEAQREPASSKKNGQDQELAGKGSSGSWSAEELATFPVRPPRQGRRSRGLPTDERSPSEGRHVVRAYFSTAVKGWIESASDYKRTFPNWPLEDSLLHRHLSAAQLALYDYWWNSVFFQMAAFAEPLFYPDVSMSANYGGLGFLVAKNLFKAFDFKRGTRLDAKRQLRDWMSHYSRQSYERKRACTGHDDEVLAHVAALEIAFAAFVRSTAESRSGDEGHTERRLLPGQSETLSPEMLFFLVYCRALCDSPLGCGEVLKRVKRFGRAFQCSQDSPMVSMPSCTFFAD
ncbi:uncharacterized protein LOC142579841 [Dermacentor variabilis]|uniref:uncharacterized protein LOC142579841 n=1 Tax=Dermacentor variabilis TaxID=34621 RepID=UPI003F5C6753